MAKNGKAASNVIDITGLLGKDITLEQILEMTPTSKSALNGLVKDSDNWKEEIDGLTGELREAIKHAVEKQHLDKDAFADLKRYHRVKSNEKLATRFRTLIAYMVLTGVMARIQSVPLLPLDGEAEGEEVQQAAE